jgi:hypothetical protein
MKIRIKGNSLRMRLTKSEVAKFKNDGLILEQTHALGGVFNYTLLKSAGGLSIHPSIARWHGIVSVGRERFRLFG